MERRLPQDSRQQTGSGGLARRAGHTDELHLLDIRRQAARSSSAGAKPSGREEKYSFACSMVIASILVSMFVEQPAHPAQGQTEQAHQNTGHHARKIQPDVGELAAPAIAEHLDGLVRQGREQTAQDRPRDVNEKVPGVDPQAESEQEAFQRILAEMCQLAHDVVCQMVRRSRAFPDG